MEQNKVSSHSAVTIDVAYVQQQCIKVHFYCYLLINCDQKKQGHLCYSKKAILKKDSH